MTEQKLKFEFTESEANTILTALVHLPYKDSATLINSIHAQAKSIQEQIKSKDSVMTTLENDTE